MNNNIQNQRKFHNKMRYCLLAVIVLFSTTLQAQYSKEVIDSLEMRANTPSLSDHELYLTYHELISAYLHTDREKSLEYVRKGIHLAEKNKVYYYFVELYHDAGAIHFYLNQLDSARYYYEQGLAMHEKAVDNGELNIDELNYLQMRLFLGIANIDYTAGKYDLVLESYYKALEITEKLHKLDEAAFICLSIANMYKRMSNYEQAEVYYVKAENIYSDLNDENGIAYAYLGLSAVYKNKNDQLKSLQFAEKSYRILTNLPNARPLYLMESARALTDIWLAIGDYEKALKFALNAVDHARQTNRKDCMATTLGTLSQCYLKQKKYSEAEETAFQALAVDSTKMQINSNLYQIISEANIWMKHSEKAIDYFRKTIEAKDAYSNQNFQTSLSEMDAKYKTEQKELQITALKKEKRLMNWLSISGGILLCLALITLLFLWRWTVQKRRLAEQQHELAEVHISQLEHEKQLIATQSVLNGEVQERSRLARDLHDGLGSMLTGLKLNLELLKNNTSLVADEANHFDKAMQILNNSMVEMRRVAHHLMPDTLSRYGLKAALSDFLKDIPSVEFAWFGSDDRISDPQKEIMIYRIIHELVNNALKHSGATKICVNVMCETDYIAFTVFDNGCGFTPTTKSNGMGLSNIRERVASCNGRIDINSQAGKGTEINVELRIES